MDVFAVAARRRYRTSPPGRSAEEPHRMNVANFAPLVSAIAPAEPFLPGYEKFVESIGRYPDGNISYLYATDSLDALVMGAYFGILLLLAVYGFYRLRVTYLFWRYARTAPPDPDGFAEDELPYVTVQLPLFNEMYVAERLIEACVAIDYPARLLEIQVLDDSTDETTDIVAACVARHRAQGVDVVHIRRGDRTGYKAGALAAGLDTAKGQLVAVFDADFVPKPDSIRRMVTHFSDARVGMVQMRWSHINRDYSLLTRVQAMMLDGHFVVEQAARNRSGAFFNFNGTAGMWRREAIEWSGGWQHDTLTEDTDLSFRAQLCGWRFVYLLDDEVPSELPVDLNAFKAQQRRWAKGLIEVAIKLMPRVWRDPRLSIGQRLELFFRLTGNVSAPLLVALATLHLPVLIVRYNQGLYHLLLFDAPLLVFSTASVAFFYLSGQIYLRPKNWAASLWLLPIVMATGIGLSFSNSKAVLEALLRRETSFVRTPKFGVEAKGDITWLRKRYKRARGLMPALELLLAAYFVATIAYALSMSVFGTIPFLLLFLLGYGYTGIVSLLGGGGIRGLKSR
jgi:cellulose synthase/poly-beta-1,6-N-acetylglucosamine synthase-like glycosyltransferase